MTSISTFVLNVLLVDVKASFLDKEIQHAFYLVIFVFFNFEKFCD